MLADTSAKLQRKDLSGGRGPIAVAAGLAGVAVMLFAAALAVLEIHAIWRSSKAAGQIVKLVARNNTARPAPVVVFVDASGAHHTFMSERAASAARYRPGDDVVVLYDAADPTQARLADYPDAFARALLAASGGALLLLIAGLIGQRRPVRPVGLRAGGASVEGGAGVAHPTEALARRPSGREPELQFHPFNAVAVKHYLSGLGKPASDRKVRLTEGRLALAQGRVPVALAEFLGYACAIAYHENAARYLSSHCPRASLPQCVTHNQARALCFLFEGVIVIAVVDPDGAHPFAAPVALFTPHAGPRQYVPEDTVWDGAPRARAPARTWSGLREGVEAWLKGVLPTREDDDRPPILMTGHERGGAAAMLAAYEFAKRGRNVAGVITFGSQQAGGRAFAADYRELGLDERTLHIAEQRPARSSWVWPFGIEMPGSAYGLDHRPAGEGSRAIDPKFGLTRPALAAILAEEMLDRATGYSLGRRFWLGLLSASPSARLAIMRYDIERRYALALTTLIHKRLLELFLADGSAEPAHDAYAALSEHLLDFRGVRPENADEAFLTLRGLPTMAPITALAAGMGLQVTAPSA